MKIKLLTIITACQIMTASNAIAEETELIGQIKLLTTQVEDSALKQGRRIDPSEPMTFRGTKSAEFQQLQEVVSANWNDILGNMETLVASSDVRQFILFRSFFDLPHEDFFQCLNEIVDLVIADKVNKPVFMGIFHEYEIKFAGDGSTHTLARHYDHPVVSEIFRKAKIICLEHSEYFNEVLSGEIKRWLEKEERNAESREKSNANKGEVQSGIVNADNVMSKSALTFLQSESSTTTAPLSPPSRPRLIWLWLLAFPAAGCVWFSVRRARRKA